MDSDRRSSVPDEDDAEKPQEKGAPSSQGGDPLNPENLLEAVRRHLNELLGCCEQAEPITEPSDGLKIRPEDFKRFWADVSLLRFLLPRLREQVRGAPCGNALGRLEAELKAKRNRSSGTKPVQVLRRGGLGLEGEAIVSKSAWAAMLEVQRALPRASAPDPEGGFDPHAQPVGQERTAAERELARAVSTYWSREDGASWAEAERRLEAGYSGDELVRRHRAPPDPAHLPFARLLLAAEDMLAAAWPDGAPSPERLAHARRVLFLARLATDADLAWNGVGYAEGGPEGMFSRASVLEELHGEGARRERFYALIGRALEEVGESEAALERGPSAPGADDASRGDDASIRHAEDFSWLAVGEQTYEFTPKQRAAVQALYEARQSAGDRDGHGLTLETLRERSGSGAHRFRVGDLFRDNPAYKSIIRKGRTRDTWALYLDA